MKKIRPDKKKVKKLEMDDLEIPTMNELKSEKKLFERAELNLKKFLKPTSIRKKVRKILSRKKTYMDKQRAKKKSYLRKKA